MLKLGFGHGMNLHRSALVPPSVPVGRRWRSHASLGVVLALMSSLLVLGGAVPAQAATPVYEIKGQWVNPPATVARGNPVVAEWRINVNDRDQPPSNDPVDNVTATFEVAKAFFDEIPDMCLTEGVEPPSSISEDGRSLTCNFGTVRMGTAIIVQTPVVADGITGEEVQLSGTSPGGQTVALPPIPIRNPFDMDMHWRVNTAVQSWNDDLTAVDLDLQWTLRLGKGSDPGPQQVSYTLRVNAIDGSNVNVGVHPRGGTGCTRFDFGQADGHPWSRTDIPLSHERNTSFVDSCTLVETGTPGVFRLSLSGINYSLLNVPSQDSFGKTLPADWDAIASGTTWFRVITDRAGSIQLTMDPVTYTSQTGLTDTDNPGNNTTNKPYTLPGSWSGAWHRAYTGSGGGPWDDTYRVSAGTTVRQFTNNRFFGDTPPDPNTAMYGSCLALDTRYATFNPTAGAEGTGVDQVAWSLEESTRVVRVGQIEYYVGGSPLLDPTSALYDPDQFDCSGSAGWTTTPPTDPASVRAVRVSYPHSAFAANDAEVLQLRAYTTLNGDLPVGRDVWMFASVLRDGTWSGPAAGSPITTTPDARYPYTNGRRDILRIISARPFIEKSAARSTVTPGVPADFTLTYSANGSGSIPEFVDGYRIRDVLPLGMTYEPGSADPEPAVSMDLQGRQVLTWTLDGVATNTRHALPYQAVADSSVAPGTQLTNTATSSYGGEESAPATETVTTTTNGYTVILKTADVEFIPNQNGDGVGTGSWTVAIESRDPLPQSFTDTIDILPYNGDQRGTSFSGSYSLDEVVVPDGGTVYYTDAAPTTLSDDPAAPSNGAAGDPSGNSVGWTTTRPANPTAVRVIGPELEPGATFAFQVVISTDGARPQDVYVNRAQARAEHTELVMRTSARLVVTDYVVEKSSAPVSGSTLRPGDVVTYTVRVTQQGPVPAGAWFTDRLTNVFDDAVYNDDLAASIGTATLDGNVLSWEGVVPVGEVAVITYSVTVKDVPGLRSQGNTWLRNRVVSPGCDEPAKCTTEHPVGYFVYSKTSDPAPGRTVQVGEVVTYKVRIAQRGAGAVANASITDDLSAVLDDARWNDDVRASTGKAVRDGRRLTWTGDLGIGEVATLRYSVTVKAAGEGDDQLANVVTTDDNRGFCVPAHDQNPDCRTSHRLGDYEVVKTSDPVSGSDVEIGDVVRYTVTVSHLGIAPVRNARLRDDLSRVLDDATWNRDLRASAGEASFDTPVLRWSGRLEVGDQVRLRYSVTVTAQGDGHLQNVVSSPGQCQVCSTEHFTEPLVLPAAAGLPGVGAPRTMFTVLALALGLLTAGAAMLVAAGRRRRTTRPPTSPYVPLNDLL